MFKSFILFLFSGSNISIGDHIITIDVGQRIKNQPQDTLDLHLKYIFHVK